MQPQQSPLHQPAQLAFVAVPAHQRQIALDGLHQLPERRADEQVAAPRTRWVLTQQVIEQPGSAVAAALGDAVQRGPFSSQGHPDAVRVVFAQREAAAAGVAAPVAGDALDRAGHVLGADMAVAGVLQSLGGEAQVQRRRFPDSEVGGRLAHPVDQLPFQFGRLGEPAV